MADTESSKKAESEEVTLTNVSRRPLLMRLPGKTLRLGPGDRQTVPKALLATTELLRMCEQRFVVVSPTSEPKAEAETPKPEARAVPSEQTPEASAAAESQPATEAEAAESQPTTEPAAPESQPTTEPVAASGSESDSAVVKPEVSPEGAGTPQAPPTEKKSTKTKPKPEQN